MRLPSALVYIAFYLGVAAAVAMPLVATADGDVEVGSPEGTHHHPPALLVKKKQSNNNWHDGMIDLDPEGAIRIEVH